MLESQPTSIEKIEIKPFQEPQPHDKPFQIRTKDESLLTSLEQSSSQTSCSTQCGKYFCQKACSFMSWNIKNKALAYEHLPQFKLRGA